MSLNKMSRMIKSILRFGFRTKSSKSSSQAGQNNDSNVVLLFGPCKSGKTQIFNRLTKGCYDGSYFHTFTNDVDSATFNNTSVVFYDFGYDVKTTQIDVACKTLIVVLDLSDLVDLSSHTIQELVDLELLRYEPIKRSQTIIIGNKCDLLDEFDSVKMDEMMVNVCNRFDAGYLSVSALNRYNLNKLLALCA